MLAEYQHPHFGRHPAVTTAATGSGRITVVGTVPDAVLGRALAQWLVPVADDAWRGLVSGSVTVSSATSGAGRRLHFVHNWSWEPTTVTLPSAVRDALGAAPCAAGDEIELGPWDVRVLVEE